MKKTKKLTPILTGTLLVLPSLLFLSSAQKSNAAPMLGNVVRGAGKLLSSGIKVNTSGIGGIKLNTQNISKSKLSSAASVRNNGFANKNYNPVNKTTSLPAGMKLNSTTQSSTRPLTTSSSTIKNNGGVIVTSTSSNSTTSFEGVNPNATVRTRLLQTLAANGITPANPTKNNGTGNLTLRRNNSTLSTTSTTSTSSTDSVQLDGIDPGLPIQNRLLLTLHKNGITPANKPQVGLGSSDLSRLSSSDV